MALWLVRAGSRGEHEELALEQGIVSIGWSELGDLTDVGSREALLERLRKALPDAKPSQLGNWAGQIWAFAKEITPGDLVALPLKSRPKIAFGEVTGPYVYRPEAPHHARPVRWINEVSRSDIDQDLLYSFGAYMTVCRVHRNNAEARIRALLQDRAISSAGRAGGEEPRGEVPGDDEMETDIEQVALDQIRRFIQRRFKGHRLADLVAAVLTAQGFKVWVAPEGPDGGVDILAGSGELGFDGPRIAVQVKSGDVPVDVKAVRELQGAMKNFQASHGLFVSWGGFKSSVAREAGRSFFEIRLWGPDELMREVLRLYERLPEDLQAALPLKRIWALVPSVDALTPE